MNSYQKKYLKYKSKYLLAKNELEQEGGAFLLDETEDIYPIVEPNEGDFKKQASIEGKQLLDKWLGSKVDDIKKITELFNDQGKPNKINATAFSDYYKWTMMPVIWHLHKFITAKTDKKTFKVTFGIDIRDKPMREAINKPENTELRNAIKTALDDLAKRPFDMNIFEKMNKDDKLLNNTIPHDCINYICRDRNLAATVTMSEIRRPEIIEDEEVHISFFKDANAKYSPSDAEEGLWFIEARGPWPRVTWLETSMMQAVYEAYLRYNLDKLVVEKEIKSADGKLITSEKAYERWLYGALLRCAKSVAFTRLVQNLDGKLMTPALFTGRRTGGYLFLLLQNLFFAHHFIPFIPPPPKVLEDTDASYQEKLRVWKQEKYIEGNTTCLGTSSVDCYYELTNLELPCLRPVGTHAHELSMVISVLFPYFDDNKYELPLTQIIGHELYRTLSAVPRPTPSGAIMFPMLPDTLGTAAFMKAANWVKKDGQPFISLINSARQDSGKLPNFLTLMTQWNYNLGKMASEIDDTETLLNATGLGYTTSGAGGFYGDSVKVWNPDKQYQPPSMAVKAVNVEYCVPEAEKKFYEGLNFPHITIINKSDNTGHVKGYPIKVGDPEDIEKPALAEGKLSLDKTLPAETIEAIKNWVSARRVQAFKNLNNDKIRSDHLDIGSFTGYNLTPKSENFKSVSKFTG